jgi:hypothetical protein
MSKISRLFTTYLTNPFPIYETPLPLFPVMKTTLAPVYPRAEYELVNDDIIYFESSWSLTEDDLKATNTATNVAENVLN